MDFDKIACAMGMWGNKIAAVEQMTPLQITYWNWKMTRHTILTTRCPSITADKAFDSPGVIQI